MILNHDTVLELHSFLNGGGMEKNGCSILLAFLNVATKNKVLNLISSNDARNAYWYLLMT